MYYKLIHTSVEPKITKSNAIFYRLVLDLSPTHDRIRDHTSLEV